MARFHRDSVIKTQGMLMNWMARSLVAAQPGFYFETEQASASCIPHACCGSISLVPEHRAAWPDTCVLRNYDNLYTTNSLLVHQISQKLPGSTISLVARGLSCLWICKGLSRDLLWRGTIRGPAAVLFSNGIAKPFRTCSDGESHDVLQNGSMHRYVKC